MQDTLAGIELGQALVNLRQEYESFDGVVKGRVGRQILQGVQNSIPGTLG
jgi:hypothetical protein